MNEHKFATFFDKLAWMALTGVTLYASSQLSKLTQSVQDLSTNFAVIVTKMEVYEGQSRELRTKVSGLEEKIYTIKK